jgi:hypothetical protein
MERQDLYIPLATQLGLPQRWADTPTVAIWRLSTVTLQGKEFNSILSTLRSMGL